MSTLHRIILGLHLFPQWQRSGIYIWNLFFFYYSCLEHKWILSMPFKKSLFARERSCSHCQKSHQETKLQDCHTHAEGPGWSHPGSPTIGLVSMNSGPNTMCYPPWHGWKSLFLPQLDDWCYVHVHGRPVPFLSGDGGGVDGKQGKEREWEERREVKLVGM